MSQREDGTPERNAPDPAQRLADHAAIDRLTAGLLPALVERVAASGLGELEVREGGWRVRLRMPAEAAARAADAAAALRESARREAEEAVTEASAAVAGGNGTRGAAAEAADPQSSGLAGQPAPASGSVPGTDAFGTALDGNDEAGRAQAVATAPAVGFFRPRANLGPGARLKAGDVVGFVDVLGVPKDVKAPAPGTLQAFLVEPGEPVEYGQEILEIDTAEPAGHASSAASTAEPPASRAAAGPKEDA